MSGRRKLYWKHLPPDVCPSLVTLRRQGPFQRSHAVFVLLDAFDHLVALFSRYRLVSNVRG